MLASIQDRIHDKLTRLYGAEHAPEIARRLDQVIRDAGFEIADPGAPPPLAVSEADAMLITYGDSIRREGEPPLVTLRKTLKELLQPEVNSVHILPFYPYSSDDGFSVIDYMQVDPELGEWAHIRALGQEFRLMFDAVFNHISAQSEWFQAFLRGEAPYRDYFVTADPSADLSMVVRPRALPLLTPFQTREGEKHVWTTFSDDQVDLNYANPDVLLDLIRILLFYVQQGAQFIRLDAIAFLWKVPGTSSIHLPETHLVIQLMRDVLDATAPDTVLITETNVPHEENISYFGDGTNEAQMVYQFPLPPLVLHTLTTGSSARLSQWAASLEQPGERTTFFNFTASHDGIGVRPVTGLLSDRELDALVELAQEHGGYVSFRSLPDGRQDPYELNITYFDAITHPDVTARDPQTAVARFIVSQAIMLSLAGVPGIYIHSLFGSRNDLGGVERTGRYRSINREKLPADQLLAELIDSDSLRARVYRRYRELLRARRSQPAFHPLAPQRVHTYNDHAFIVERIARDGSSTVLALHNVTGEALTLQVWVDGAGRWRDLLSDTVAEAATNGLLEVTLAPYQVMWLRQ